mgnify:FL=1
MRSFSIVDPVFKTEPVFIGNCTAEEATAYLLKRFRVRADIPSGLGGTTLTFACPPWRVVWVRRMSRAPGDFCVFVHEVFHLVTRICQDKGIPVIAHHPDGMNGDETAAYLLEFFIRNILRRIRQ